MNADFFTGIHQEWRDRVAAYIAAGGAPNQTPTWPAIEPRRTAFLTLYKSPQDPSTQGPILKAMRALGKTLALCPSCGEPGAPNTLDHFLPKDIYPHFSITPYNLFPMCDACQLEKGTKTGNGANPKFFLHPYFDNFTAAQVVTLTIHPPFEAPTFELGASLALPVQQAMLVTAHLRELRIEERYGHYFRGEHRRLLRLVGKMRNSGQQVEPGIENFRLLHHLKSPNSWEHVFFESVMSNQPLLQYLTTADLPAFL